MLTSAVIFIRFWLGIEPEWINVFCAFLIGILLVTIYVDISDIKYGNKDT
jgi:hypothetical protein